MASSSGLQLPVRWPSLLLADEPTGALDSKTGAEVLGLFDELHRQGLTLVVVTHDMGVAQRAERIITLKDGLIISDAANGRLQRRKEAQPETVRLVAEALLTPSIEERGLAYESV